MPHVLSRGLSSHINSLAPSFIWHEVKATSVEHAVISTCLSRPSWGNTMYIVLWESRVCEAFTVIHETSMRGMPWRFTKLKTIVGHLPQEIAKTCYCFTRHKGNISGAVVEQRVDSEAGGLEVPCRLKFTGSSRNFENWKKSFKKLESPTVRIV